MRIGSLFSGYGGLELGIQSVLGGDVIWHSEIEAAPSRVLAAHWPDVPNLGDITAIDWSTAPHADVLCGGFPCQDVSLAGLRRGLRPDTRSGLWSHFALAIAATRPSLVIVENVRGLLSAEAHSDLEPDPWDLGDRPSRPALRALGAVLGDLADLGYDARWCGLRAADAGAPHARYRVFVVAYPNGGGQRPDLTELRARESDAAGRAAEDADGAARDERWSAAPREAEGGRPRADARGRGRAPATDTERERRERRRGDEDLARATRTAERAANQRERDGHAADDRSAAAADTQRDERARERPQQQRRTAPARDRAAAPDTRGVGRRAVTSLNDEDRPIALGHEPDGRSAADAPDDDRRRRAGTRAADRRPWGGYGAAIARWETVTGRTAPQPTVAGRLAPPFVEWMMGLPLGHVTDPVIGLSRSQQLRALGNGVVPQQAELALRTLLDEVAA